MSVYSETEQFNFSYMVQNMDKMNQESIRRLELFDTNINDFTMVNTLIKQAHFVHATIENVRMAQVQFENSEMTLVTFKNCILRDVSFKTSMLRKITFENCSLDHCSFQMDNHIDEYEYIKFNNCVLNNLDLEKANIAPDAEGLVTNSILGNVTISKRAVDISSNILLERKKSSSAKTEEKKTLPTKKASRPDQKPATNEIEKMGDTETAPLADKFSGRFGGIEILEKKEKEE
jgi:hypothetical protein